MSTKKHLYEREGKKIKINSDKCTGCFSCIPYCPMEAIKKDETNNISEIDQENCVECGVCLRSGICPVDAIFWPDLSWPRVIRQAFSAVVFGYDVLEKVGIHGYTARKLGRGTSEMKTNDTTGRYKDGEVGIGAEIGRPGIGFHFKDLEKVTMAMMQLGVELEPGNPVMYLLDQETGKIKYREILNEKAMSAIIEMNMKQEKVLEVLKALYHVAKEIDTVITIDVINKCKSGTIPIKPILEEAGYKLRINGKTCMGLGRPLIP